jgi:hypothetical protein
MLSRDLGYIGNDEYKVLDKKIQSIIRMLTGLIRSLKPKN